jgi:hypothetical protein
MVMGPARLGAVSDCTANYRPVFSDERTPHFNNDAIVRLKKIKNLVMGPQGGLNTKTTGRLSVVISMTTVIWVVQ